METKNTVQYKCPCCGGFIAYDSAAGKMKCPYCDTEFELETLKSYDESLKNDKSDDMNWISDDEKERFDGDCDGMCVYVCQSCGGEIIAEETTAAEKSLPMKAQVLLPAHSAAIPPYSNRSFPAS